MIIGTIATICIQAYTAYSNYSKNKENAEEIKRIQREYKQSKLNNSLKRDLERFHRSCELQLQMEEDEHNFKIDNARQKFMDSIDSLIHKQELRDYYPLVISPQIISNSILPTCLDEVGYVREHILCVLSNSNNSLFNKLIFTELDNYLSVNFAKYWNKCSQHQVCYYTNVWKKDKLLSYDASDWNNLRPLISSPTVFITPLVSSSNDVTIRITFMVNGKEFHCDKDLHIKFDVDPSSSDYQQSVSVFKSRFKEIAFNEILCDAAFVVDSHYWRNHKFPPRLPRLLASNVISLKKRRVEEYMLGYESFFRNAVLGNIDETTSSCDNNDIDEIKLLATINQFNYPQRSISYLESMFEVVLDKEKAELLVNDTLTSICKARVLEDGQEMSEISVSQFDVDDIDAISKLADLSRTRKLDTRKISSIIQKWICNL